MGKHSHNIVKEKQTALHTVTKQYDANFIYTKIPNIKTDLDFRIFVSLFSSLAVLFS